MAALARRAGRSAAISMVYTPSALRGRGYAGSVTAALTARAFAQGKTLVCLFTDRRNPYSNRCYEKIGFRLVCNAMLFPQQSG
jgi:predicted GNAT family acetyltransferase